MDTINLKRISKNDVRACFALRRFDVILKILIKKTIFLFPVKMILLFNLEMIQTISRNRKLSDSFVRFYYVFKLMIRNECIREI